MNLSAIITKENITFLLATIGSVGTICSAILSLVRNHRNISIKIVDLYKDDNFVYAYIMFENNSRLPISINRLSLIYKNEPITCSPKSENFVDITLAQNGCFNKNSIFSMSFPLYLPELGCASGYVYFVLPQEDFETLPTHLSFQVGTNRGMIMKRKLSYELKGSLDEL